MGTPRAGVRRPGAAGKLLRHHPPVAQKDEPVRQGGLAGVVGHHEKGLAAIVHQAPQQGQDLAAGGAVQVAGGLVGQEDQGVGHQGPGDGHALLLAARQFAGQVGPPPGQPNQVQGAAGAPPGFPGRQTRDGQRQGHVLLGRQHVEKVEGLKDYPDPAPAEQGPALLPQGGQLLAAHADAAGAGAIQAGHQV
jgi:hypothetical protein